MSTVQNPDRNLALELVRVTETAAIAAAPWVDEQIFMLQAEVVERITAPAGDSEYSRLSVMLQARYHVDYLMDVPPTAFEPQPKVDSAVIRMIPKVDFYLK